MNTPRLPLAAAAVAFALLAAPLARAQVSDPSPFLPPGAVPGGGPGGSGDAQTLELRGVMSTPRGERYCIYDPAKKASTWSGVNEAGLGFVVTSADPARNAVVVQQAGRSVRLVLKEAKIGASAGAAQMTLGRIGPGNPGAVALSPAEEAARLQAVAEEVRRRREQREQNALQQQGGPRPAPQQ
jgi:hypothetical protein